jgi:hypothetical protein
MTKEMCTLTLSFEGPGANMVLGHMDIWSFSKIKYPVSRAADTWTYAPKSISTSAQYVTLDN